MSTQIYCEEANVISILKILKILPWLNVNLAYTESDLKLLLVTSIVKSVQYIKSHSYFLLHQVWISVYSNQILPVNLN